MEVIKIPNTDLEVSRLVHGCMNIGGEWNNEPITELTLKSAKEAVRTAHDIGINFFDLADIYVLGKSEIAFANAIKNLGIKRDDIVIQSKCGIRFAGDPYEGAPKRYDFSYNYIMNSVDGILKRLETDYLDILLLHRPDALAEPEEIAKAFNELKNNGKVRYFGVSNFNRFQLEFYSKFIDVPLVANQLEFSLLHNHLVDEGVTVNMENDKIYRNDGTLEYCQLNKISVQAWSPLAKGILFQDNKFESVRKIIDELADKNNATQEAIITSWILKHPAQILPVVGTTNVERIKGLGKATEIDLSREDWYKLFEAARGKELP